MFLGAQGISPDKQLTPAGTPGWRSQQQHAPPEDDSQSSKSDSAAIAAGFDTWCKHHWKTVPSFQHGVNRQQQSLITVNQVSKAPGFSGKAGGAVGRRVADKMFQIWAPKVESWPLSGSVLRCYKLNQCKIYFYSQFLNRSNVPTTCQILLNII